MLAFLGIVHRGAYTPPRTDQTSGGGGGGGGGIMWGAAASRISGTLQNSGASFSAHTLDTNRGYLGGPLMLKTGRGRETTSAGHRRD